MVDEVGRSMTRREWILLAVAMVGVLFSLFGLSKWLLDYDGRQAIDLVGYVESPSRYMPEAEMATEDLCSDMVPCVQAVDSDSLTMRRFESAPQASAIAAMLGGDVRVAGWVLVAFKPGALTDEEKEDFISALYCTHVPHDPC